MFMLDAQRDAEPYLLLGFCFTTGHLHTKCDLMAKTLFTLAFTYFSIQLLAGTTETYRNKIGQDGQVGFQSQKRLLHLINRVLNVGQPFPLWAIGPVGSTTAQRMMHLLLIDAAAFNSVHVTLS